ncbi:IDEAL domain-containing protein [Lysinibacillus sp. NPDC097287]|uniref:IDEAL domain-containing protein n=1 Tax=Lysinibacillus sp. NPDC097287 TaxID=3364144 RepID=UPI0038092E61
MTEDIYYAIKRAAMLMAIKEGLLVSEGGTLLNKSTVELVSEIEEVNRQHLIDTALATGNRELFMQLTN